MMRKTMDFVKERFGNQVLVGAEVGVSNGHHAQNILQEMPNIKLLYLIDPYFGDLTWTEYNKTFVDEKKKANTKTRLSQYKGRICWVYKEFEKCTVEDIPEPLDFIYIDGDHAYKHLIKDLTLAAKLVKKGGVIGGHDAGCLSLEKAIAEFCEAKQFERLNAEGGISNGSFNCNGTLKCQGWDWWMING